MADARPLLSFFTSLMPLSRLFVSLLLSKQAVTPIPHWLPKTHTYTHVQMLACRRTVAEEMCSEKTDPLCLSRVMNKRPLWECAYAVCTCWIRLILMRPNERKENAANVIQHLLCFSVCMWLVYICPETPPISHPAAHQSSPRAFVCLHRFAPSVSNPWTDPCLTWTEGGPLAFWSKCHSRLQWNRYFASNRHYGGLLHSQKV